MTTEQIILAAFGVVFSALLTFIIKRLRKLDEIQREISLTKTDVAVIQKIIEPIGEDHDNLIVLREVCAKNARDIHNAWAEIRKLAV